MDTIEGSNSELGVSMNVMMDLARGLQTGVEIPYDLENVGRARAHTLVCNIQWLLRSFGDTMSLAGSQRC